MTQVQSDKQTPPSAADQASQVDGRLAAQLKGVAREINNASALRSRPPKHHNEGAPRFVELTERLYDAALEAANQQVIRAENLRNRIQQEAEVARSAAKARWQELQELERNLEDMSSEMLQAFKRYGEPR
jgi:hypothetical protein